MKKKIWVIILIITALFITGCGNKQETPEQVVANAFQALKERDLVQIQHYFPDEEGILDLRSDVPQDDEVLDALLKHLECTVISSSVSGNNATVNAKIKNVNFGAVFEEWFGIVLTMAFADAFSEDSSMAESNTEELFLNMLKRDGNEMHTSIIDIQLNKLENVWVMDITDNEKFQDAIFGGMIASLEKMANSFK